MPWGAKYDLPQKAGLRLGDRRDVSLALCPRADRRSEPKHFLRLVIRRTFFLDRTDWSVALMPFKAF